MDNNQIIKYKEEIYGIKYQNSGIFNNIEKKLIQTWREKDRTTIEDLYITTKNIEQYLHIDNRLELAIKCGAFLMDDGYNKENDKIWKGKGNKAITINEYQQLSTENKKKTIPVCPGDEVQYYGAFGLHWGTHTGIYMGTDNSSEYGKIIEVDSNIQPDLENRIYSFSLMMALGYICGKIICDRDLNSFTFHYHGNDPIIDGPKRPTSVIENQSKYTKIEIIKRAIKTLEIKKWEYNIQNGNCETFTKFIITGQWNEDSFFYVRILENLFESHIKNYTNSNEITEIYKFMIIAFNKTESIDVQKNIFKIIQNINKNLVENETIEISDFIKDLNNNGLNIIRNINKIKTYKNLKFNLNNLDKYPHINEKKKSIHIEESIHNKNSNILYQEIINNQKILLKEIKEIKEINNKLIKNKEKYLDIIQKLVTKI